MDISRILVAATFVLATLGCQVVGTASELAGPARAGDRVWNIEAADCAVRILSRRLSERNEASDAREAGSSRETEFEIQCGHGTFVYAAVATDHLPVVTELTALVTINSNRRGLQLMARVVLPRSTEPNSDAPITMMIPGPLYERVGHAQELALTDLPALVERHARVLRKRLQTDVDTRQAYVDRIVVNIYGGVGKTRVALRDAGLSGLTATADGLPRAVSRALPSFRVVSHSQVIPEDRYLAEAAVRMEGSLLTTNGQPFTPLVIEHQGESFPYLKSLGFNTIWLSRPATRDQLRWAESLDLWLVCPPPDLAGGQSIEQAHRPVLAWMVTRDSCPHDIPATRSLRQQITAADPFPSRPVVGQGEFGPGEGRFAAWENHLDIAIQSRSTIGTTFPFSNYPAWLRGRIAAVRQGVPFWVTVPTELPAAVVQQTVQFGGSLEIGTPIQFSQCQKVAYAALANGSRGFVFRSSTSLSDDSSAAVARSTMLSLLNSQLRLIGSWAAAGRAHGSLETSDGEYHTGLLETDRAHLAVAVRLRDDDQYVSTPSESATRSLHLTVPAPPLGSAAYRVTPSGLRPLPHRHVTGGMTMEITEPGHVEVIVLTKDNRVVNSLVGQLGRQRAEDNDRRVALVASRWDELEPAVSHFEPSRGSQTWSRAYSQAKSQWTRSQLLLRAGSLEDAERVLDQTSQSLDQIGQTIWQQHASKVSHVAAFPPYLHVSALAGLTKTMLPSSDDRQSLRIWLPGDPDKTGTPNQLPEGDFESPVATMVQSGWQLNQSASNPHGCSVLLAHDSTKRNRLLRMELANERSVAADGGGEPIVWVTSPPIAIAPARLVRISGRVRVTLPGAVDLDGLIVFDSVGGPDLAARFYSAPQWQPFVLFRAVPDGGNVSLTLALTQPGQVEIDDLAISTLGR